MKGLKLAIVFLITTITAYGQNFEGKVIYKNDYKSKLPGTSNEQLSTMMGTIQEYAFKNGNYKSSTNGTFFQWQLFIHKDNKLYSKLASSAAILWNDGAENKDEVIKAEINKDVTEILGQKCDELILTCKSGIQKYYYSSGLKIDPKFFEKHKFGNWNEIMSRTKSLPLKIVIDNPQFKIESIATEIIPMKLDNILFELPAGSKIEKSPF